MRVGTICGRRCYPVALLTASLLPVAPSAGAATAAGTVWRGCAGVEEGVVLAAPAALRNAAGGGQALGATLSLTPRLAGCTATAALVAGEQGKRVLLVRVKPPVGARAGRHKGTLMVRQGAAVARVPLVVEVLPFALMRPSKQYCLNHVPVGSVGGRAPEEAEAAHLRPLRDLGIGSLALANVPVDRSNLETAMRAAGMRGPVMVTIDLANERPPSAAPPSSTVAPGSRVLPAPIRWYAVLPERPGSTDAVAGLKRDGFLVACEMYGAVDPAQEEGVDLPIYEADGPFGTRVREQKISRPASVVGWWYWDVGARSALANRLFSGASLWKSGLSGALLAIDPATVAEPGWTLRWEGVRQGVLDSRYLTTFYALVRQVKDKDRANRLPAQAEEAVTTALNGLTQAPSTTAAQRFRDMVITWTVRLQRVVGSG